MANDITAIPMNQSQTCARASPTLNRRFPVSAGSKRHVAAKSVNATGPPTVMWKWPTTHIVL